MGKDLESTATVEKTEKIEKIIYGSFLRDEKVSVRPVESQGKWANLLVAGQDKKKDAFIYNKVKRSFQVPLKDFNAGGGVKAILDDLKRVHVQKYAVQFPSGMTQKEFFEKELGVDLNTTLKTEDNFWKIDKRSRVTITKAGMTLNLAEPIDMLKYLILLSDVSRISPSYEQSTKKATYEFMIVNENKLISKRVETGKIKAKAYAKFAEITSSETKMVGFIKSIGRIVPVNRTEDWLESEILNVLENSAEGFLKIVEDPTYDKKIFVQNSIEVGAILKKGDKRYTLDNGVELGDLGDTINFLGNPDNQDIRLRIKSLIELSGRK